MLELNYTDQGRRPSAQQVVSDWKKGGCPDEFTAEYGETFAHFEYRNGWGGHGEWMADGNGCRGLKRDTIVTLLNKAAGHS